MTAILRRMTPADIDDVCALLHDNMNSKFTVDRWRALFTPSWCDGKPDLGIVAEDAGRIVGVHGHVCSYRVIEGRRERFLNFTSWYILKEYRKQGLGSGMLAMATADPEATCTVFSLSPRQTEFFKTLGMNVLEEQRLLWRRSGKTWENLELVWDPARIRQCCDLGDIRVFDDHQGLPVVPVLVMTKCTQCLLLLSRAVKRGGVVYHDVLYRSNPKLFTERVQDIAEALLPDGESVLAADRRFVEGDAGGEIETIKSPRFFKSNRVKPEDIDLAYSEIPLLGLKLD